MKIDRRKKRIELEKRGAKLPTRIVERQIKKKILPWLDREEIVIITGARQTGKSVLLYQLMYDHILPKTTNIHYFNLDIPGHLEFFADPDRMVNLIALSKRKTYVFIDEVQRLKEPGLFLKGIYDLHLPVKLIVSGSSALEIKSKIHEALTGRKVVFHLNPFNLEELSEAIFPKKGFDVVVKNEKDFKKVFNHYLKFGGYPAVAMAKNEEIKLPLLKEIFQSYIEKDIKNFLKVENEDAFCNLIKILSSQIGNIVNKQELSNSLGIHKNTLENYLFYLEQTYILDFVRPFYKNPRKELLKSPKVYFRDPGIRNFAIGDFTDFEFRPDKGSLFENFSYLYLKGSVEELTPIQFWRTKAGAEVDFIISKIRPIPFEAKGTYLKDFKISKSLRSFLQTYKPNKGYCINLSLSGKQAIEGTDVVFLTPADLINLVRKRRDLRPLRPF